MFIRKGEPFEHSEKNIILRMVSDGDFTRRYDILVPNCYTQHDNEADLFGIRKSGLCDEFEIKISRSDFLADFKKNVRYRDWGETEFHEWSKNKGGGIPPTHMAKHSALEYGFLSNYFTYVVKDGVADASEVPERFGFARVTEYGRVITDRIAKKLHPVKMPIEERFRIARKASYRYWDLIRT